MDEPFSNLDRRMREVVRHETMTLLREIGATAIIVTHDPEEAMAVADRIALMRQGEIVQHGIAADIYRRPKDLFAARFFCNFNEIPGVVRAGQAGCAFGSFPAPGLSEGLDVVICLRPQGLTLRQEGAGLAARVIARKFLGESDLLTLAVEGIDHHMRARVRGGQGPEPGRDVRVEVERDDVLVFPAAKA
jgi:iron(III) transport system ATP-binding protein